MGEIRMGLKEAGKLLGLSPNGVRARAAAGKIRHEIDNGRKWWVFLDPSTVSNDSSKLRLPKTSNITSSATSKDVDFEHERGAFEAHIGTLTSELLGVRAELAILRNRASEADRLDGEIGALKAQLDDLKGDRDRWREQASTALDHLAQAAAAPPAPPALPERPRATWWPFGRSKN